MSERWPSKCKAGPGCPCGGLGPLKSPEDVKEEKLASLIDRTAADLLAEPIGPKTLDIINDSGVTAIVERGAMPASSDYDDWYKCPGCGSLVPPEAVFGGETGYAYRICCGCSYAKQLEFELLSERAEAERLRGLLEAAKTRIETLRAPLRLMYKEWMDQKSDPATPVLLHCMHSMNAEDMARRALEGSSK